MAAITDIPETWTDAGTASGIEVWQCVAGKVAISTQVAPAADEGIQLNTGDAYRVPDGADVKLRRIGGTAAKVVREASA